MKLELARVGKANNGLSLTLSELQEAVKNFKDVRPISIDHIKTGKEPKYGEVKWIELNKDVLEGEVDLLPEVQPLFDKGMYNKWSSGFKKGDNGMYFHHLALLGAQPPAIEGLKVVNFSEDVACDVELEYNFSDDYNYKFDVIGRFMRDLREWFIGKFGADEADKIASNWKIEDVQTPPKEPATKDSINFNDKLGEEKMTIEELQKQLDEEKNKTKNFSDELSLYKKREKELKKDALKTAMNGKVPKEKIDLVLEFSDKVETGSKEFSDKKQRDFFEVLTDVFASLPSLTDTKEYDFSDSNGSSQKSNVSNQEMMSKM